MDQSNHQFLRDRVAAKLRNEGAVDVSESELHRCLANVANVPLCYRVVRQMQRDGMSDDQIINHGAVDSAPVQEALL